jgi:hypothetical protein
MSVKIDQSLRNSRRADVEQLPPTPMILSVVIPAWNEEQGIAEIVQRVLAVRPLLKGSGVDDLELIVVDDGSKDRTAEVVESFPGVRLIRHPVNRGYGAAIKTGFTAARGELLAFLDADGTYPPEKFGELCRVALEQNADVVVGSRRSGAESEMPTVRRIGNFFWSNLVSLIGNHRVADPASGMRVVRRSVLPLLYPLPDGLNFTPVMSTRSVHESLKVVEVPIAYRERLGRSKLSIVRDGSRFLATIISTALEYNPVRVLGLVGGGALGLAALIGVAIAVLRLQGVTELGPWGIWSLFSILILTVSGVSIFCLGATFNYLVSLFRHRPVRQGLFARPLFNTPLDRHFGWFGGMTILGGIALGAASLGLALSGWDLSRLWFWLVVSALLDLVGLQLAVSWIVMRILERLSDQEDRIVEEMKSTSPATAPTNAL